MTKHKLKIQENYCSMSATVTRPTIGGIILLAMLRIVFFLCLIFFMSSCHNAGHESIPITIHDGLNKEMYETGELKTEFYVTNGKRQGPYLIYDKSGTIIRQGVYDNGIKQGLCDTMIGNKLYQAYYLNDTVDALMAQKIFFTLSNLRKDHFIYFKPHFWVRNDTVIIPNCIVGKDPDYKGSKFTPTFIVTKYDTRQDSLSDVWRGYVASLKKDSFGFVITKIEGNKIYAKLPTKNPVTMHVVKLIKTKAGYFTLTCGCAEQDWTDYSPVFETMMTSFIPVDY